MGIMTNAREKLNEAKHFLGQTQDQIKNPKSFAYDLSAFLSAARSVTLFMQSEFCKVPGFRDWYMKKQEQMGNDELFKFFNDLRVITIHQRPVVPHRKISIELTASIGLSYTVTVTDKDGNIVSEQTGGTEPQKTEPTVRDLWYFEERPDEDLIELCGEYLTRLQILVDECESLFTT